MKIQFKSPWSLYQSLSLRSKEILELKDLIGLKIIVSNSFECYPTLGVVNSLYKSKKTTDYISNPKLNHYQSLHSHIVVSDKFNLLVKIRDSLMERKATYGLSYEEYKKLEESNYFKL